MASYRPLAGCKLFHGNWYIGSTDTGLPSPCGVGVVSAIVYNISVEWSTVFVQL